MQAAGDLYLCPVISRQLYDVTIDVHTQLHNPVIQQHLLWTPTQQTNHSRFFGIPPTNYVRANKCRNPKRFTHHFASFAASAI
jgi:hypothetical protein